MKTPLCSYTSLAFTLNHLIETQPENDFSFHEIFDAACDHRLLALLAERYGGIADFTGLFDSPIINVPEMEAALADAAAPFGGSGDRPTSPLSGLCLVMDIVLEAIQQQFHPRRSPRTATTLTRAALN